MRNDHLIKDWREAWKAEVEENDRLRAEVEHLLQFVYQKCPQCGIIVAPDPAQRNGSACGDPLAKGSE